MNRLTYEADSNSTGYRSHAEREELIARLAEYENTGYTPQEIYAIRRRLKHIMVVLGRVYREHPAEELPAEELRECMGILQKCIKRSREGK